MAQAKSESEVPPGDITARVVERKRTSFAALVESEKAMFIALDELNDEDLRKVKVLIDSIDYDPLFLGHDAATCN